MKKTTVKTTNTITKKEVLKLYTEYNGCFRIGQYVMHNKTVSITNGTTKKFIFRNNAINHFVKLINN